MNSGRDLIQQVATWNAATSAFNPPPRRASRWAASARPPSRHDPRSTTRSRSSATEAGCSWTARNVGYLQGRAFAHAEDGTSYELASVGKYSFENAVANPATGKATVVVGTDDSTPGQVYVYVGQKTATGNPAGRPAVHRRHALRDQGSSGVAVEPTTRALPSGTAFTAANLGDVSAKTGCPARDDERRGRRDRVVPAGGCVVGSDAPDRPLLRDHCQLHQSRRSSTGFASTTRRTRLRAASSTSWSRAPRRAARQSRRTSVRQPIASSEHPVRPSARRHHVLLQEDPGAPELHRSDLAVRHRE